MTFQEITSTIQNQFGQESILKIEENHLQPFIEIDSNNLVKICTFLKSEFSLYFDQLTCITAIDNGLEAKTIDIIYHLNSILNEHFYIIKVQLERNDLIENPSSIDSLSSIWKTADWHEREAYDLVGVYFNNHPDLRRILMPNDWVGYPLRKDYENQEKYHEIKINYK